MRYRGRRAGLQGRPSVRVEKILGNLGRLSHNTPPQTPTGVNVEAPGAFLQYFSKRFLVHCYSYGTLYDLRASSLDSLLATCTNWSSCSNCLDCLAPESGCI